MYPQSPHYLQSFLALRNEGVSFSPAFRYPTVPENSYRGGCAGDFDNDGRIDVAVLPIAGRPLLLHNDTPSPYSWIGLYLLGYLRLEGIKSDEHVGVGRLLVAIASLTFAVSLLPGMFGATLGALEAYVPPAAPDSGLAFSGTRGEQQGRGLHDLSPGDHPPAVSHVWVKER